MTTTMPFPLSRRAAFLRPLRHLVLAAGALALIAPTAPALAGSFSWPGNKVSGSGSLQKQTRALAHFDAVELGLPGHVEVRLGENESVSVETDDNLLPLIDTSVEDGVLKIRTAQPNATLAPSALRFVVQAKNIERLKVGGSGSISAPGLRGAKLEFAVGGSGSIEAPRLQAKAVAVAIGGSGNFKADGATDQLKIAIGGSGGIDAGRLAADQVKAAIGGSGTAVVWARQTLKASIGGSGDIEYYGDPQLSNSAHGSGKVRRIGAAPR